MMDAFKSDDAITVADPVCGAKLQVDQVVAQENYLGWAHYFCSASCQALFLEAPDRYFLNPNLGSPATQTVDE